MYADDTELHFSHSDFSVMEKIPLAEVENVFIWMIVNRLKVKLTESLCILVGPSQRTKGLNLFLTLDGTVLK